MINLTFATTSTLWRANLYDIESQQLNQVGSRLLRSPHISHTFEAGNMLGQVPVKCVGNAECNYNKESIFHCRISIILMVRVDSFQSVWLIKRE